MQDKQKLFRTLSTILFSTSILVGMVMFVAMNWAYFEAYFYFGYTFPADKPLSTLRCPLLMTTAETGTVTARITNMTDREINPEVRSEISYYGAARSERVTYSLAVGDTRNLSWTVTSDDMVFGHLIMARVYVFNYYTFPSYTNTCGTLVLDLHGLSGNQIFIITLTFILVCMAGGWGLWLAGNRPFHTEGLVATRAMVIFTITILLGILAGIFGLWGIGLLCAVISVFMVFVVVGFYIQKA